MTELKLYFAPGSSSMAVHIALHEIGTKFDSQPMSFYRNDTRQQPFLTLNPAGKVPTLLVDGRPLTEVAGCLFYLAKRFPEACLLPPDVPEAEAQAVSWMSFIASTLHPARRQGLEHVSTVWTIAERRLGSSQWALGAYSIADIHLFRLYWRVVNSRRERPKGLVHLDAHYSRMMDRSAVQRTIEVERAIGYELPS
jgi:glutathione S-transferase